MTTLQMIKLAEIDNHSDIFKGLKMNDVVNSINMAIGCAKNAHAPYSKFRVGCAVLLQTGESFGGFNIENISYGGTICAERNAISNALINSKEVSFHEENASTSKRKIDIEMLVVYNEKKFMLSPCGICRQFMFEFMNENALVLLVDGLKNVRIGKLNLFMPFVSFEGITND